MLRDEPLVVFAGELERRLPEVVLAEVLRCGRSVKDAVDFDIRPEFVPGLIAAEADADPLEIALEVLDLVGQFELRRHLEVLIARQIVMNDRHVAIGLLAGLDGHRAARSRLPERVDGHAFAHVVDAVVQILEQQAAQCEVAVALFESLVDQTRLNAVAHGGAKGDLFRIPHVQRQPALHGLEDAFDQLVAQSAAVQTLGARVAPSVDGGADFLDERLAHPAVPAMTADLLGAFQFRVGAFIDIRGDGPRDRLLREDVDVFRLHFLVELPARAEQPHVGQQEDERAADQDRVEQCRQPCGLLGVHRCGSFLIPRRRRPTSSRSACSTA